MQHHFSASFWKSGHVGTLVSALLYFDFCFAIWVLNGAMAPYITEHFRLSPSEAGFMMSVPVLAGALLRVPFGIVAQYIGRKNAAQINMGIVVIGLLLSRFLVDSLFGVLILGVFLGMAGASFGIALSLGSGWYPPKYKGLAMGIAGAGNSGAVLAALFAPPAAAAIGWEAVYTWAIIPIALVMVIMQVLAKEPPDREEKHSLREYLKVMVDRDVWIFNLIYMVTFGGYIGLTSFIPTLFHDQYGIAKESVGQYSAVVIVMASILRVLGGGAADKIGGIRMLMVLCSAIIALTMVAATIPGHPLIMVGILVILFSAMGAGNGAVFQLVPLRFRTTTAVAGSLVGEIGALAGGFLPNAMGIGRELSGSYAPGFMAGSLLSILVLMALFIVVRQWTTTWVGAGGKALPEHHLHFGADGLDEKLVGAK
ncbi:MAG: NarK/NasA family nitrate transporter [Chloroflexi bacterium]|nr:NarK/NasA family nitrate transporter [Chloroflexota bacterium]